jgi:hypothetical protein
METVVEVVADEVVPEGCAVERPELDRGRSARREIDVGDQPRPGSPEPAEAIRLCRRRRPAVEPVELRFALSNRPPAILMCIAICEMEENPEHRS